MCSGSGVALRGSGLSMTFLAGVSGEGFLHIAGFLRLIRCRSLHSKTHQLHQIVHVTMLSTDVMAKSTWNSSIMTIPLFSVAEEDLNSSSLFFLLVLSIVCPVWLIRKESLWPLWAVVISCLFLNHLWFFREKVRVPLSPFSSSFCFPVFGLWGGLKKNCWQRRSIFSAGLLTSNNRPLVSLWSPWWFNWSSLVGSFLDRFPMPKSVAVFTTFPMDEKVSLRILFIQTLGVLGLLTRCLTRDCFYWL